MDFRGEPTAKMIEPFQPVISRTQIAELHTICVRRGVRGGMIDDGGLPLCSVHEVVEYWPDGLDWRQRRRGSLARTMSSANARGRPRGVFANRRISRRTLVDQWPPPSTQETCT